MALTVVEFPDHLNAPEWTKLVQVAGEALGGDSSVGKSPGRLAKQI